MQQHTIKGIPVGVTPIAEHLVGVRLFGINKDELLLRSLTKEDYWLPGEIKESICDHASDHGKLPPAADCSCGIWSCKSRKGLTKSFPGSVAFQAPYHSLYAYDESWPYMAMLCARVQIWGIIIKHEWGYRSQYARIIPESICWWPRVHGRTQTNLLHYIREKYAR